ncbi:glycosyltransferase involved in cell wall biosynthesis [Flavobacterium sp. HSC-32F16]|uniref:glycosyltransferase family 2 protein n=1 Tax=Flavobacterium sp. HSC-32F16 TaxID=2910964 RepID=UPI0020A592DF|nr:glycosyltransferase family 2 protein [Flavobacterium sp. HSC-32F16]MCP2029177.1 glycosyltransferase involved in cell wall biosynthesis [Flavobacterium sp. HSC-32F16]
MIGIIIPYYKRTFFEETLKSLALQTDKRFKVYIGDDASPENPAILLERYKEKIDFVYHRFESNLGGISLTQQWERCIELSNGEEWLMILGDDDYLEETVIENWHKNYKDFSGKSNVIRFATKVVLEETKNISDAYTHPVWESAGDSLVRIFKGITRASLSEYIFSKAVFQKFGFKNYPLAWCSDHKAFLDFADGKLIYTINESIIFFRISTINISGQRNILLKQETNTVFLKDVIKDYIHLFNKTQRLELLMNYEIAIKKYRKLFFSEWIFLVQRYLLNFRFIAFAKLVRRIFMSIF